MNKHSKGDLEQMQSLPLRIKITMTERRIFDWYEYWGGDVYLSFSGGKDSTVLKHIIDNMGLSIPSVFVNTGLEYPEIQKFAMSQPNVITVRPAMSFPEVIKKYGYPAVSKEVSRKVHYARKGSEWAIRWVNETSENGSQSKFSMPKRFLNLLHAPFEVSDACCDVMKKSASKKYSHETNRKRILATMADESLLRKQAWMRTGCNAFEVKEPHSTPMAFWTEQDVLHYIKDNNVSYCSVYGDIKVKTQAEEDRDQITFAEYTNNYDGETLETTGLKRTGCMFCMFGCHLEKCPNRFQRMKETHPRQYEYCIGGGEMVEGKWKPTKEGLGLGFVLDYIGVQY